MTKSARFFRWVWRLDAILIFVATGAITFWVGALLVSRTMHAATLTQGDLTVLFERDRRLFLVSFDPESLVKRREQQMEVPQLK